MRLHLHATEAAGDGLAVLLALERLALPEGVWVYRSLPEVLAALRGRPRDDVVVILAADDAELAELAAAEEDLADRRVLLLVPDASPSTLGRGHRLRPRVLLAPPVDPELVAGIAGRMVGRPDEGRGSGPEAASP